MEPAWTERSVEDLADRLVLANGRDLGKGEACRPLESWGRAVFLVGAGCSVSAEIPLGADVAKLCARHLACVYEAHDREAGAQPRTFDEAEDALKWLIENRRVQDRRKPDGGADWGFYYNDFFDNHLTSINRQREFFDGIIRKADDRLNWAHVCLGELVKRRYIHTVLTTNFDQLVLQGIIRAGILPVVADGIESLNRVTAEPKRPQVVHLHGSMHTYDPRNSRAAIMETRKDPTLRSMLYTILHRCDLLVVVGYAGGEEGVMVLLREAARRLPPLNIFWVLRDQSSLSSGAEELMNIGDNKHVVRCADADKLFQILMNRLKIGEPDWLKDPISTLTAQSTRLFQPKDREVAKAVERFRSRVEHIDRHGRREDTPVEALDTFRIAGRYREVLDRLEGVSEIDSDGDLLRIRATTNFNLVQEAGLTGGSMDEVDRRRLQSAIEDLGRLADDAAPPDGLDAHRQLFEALMLSSDQLKNGAALDDLIARADGIQELYQASDQDDAIAVRLLIAQARQQRAGPARETSGGALRHLTGARDDFESVLGMLKGKPRDRRWTECKDGLATTLQQLAELEYDDGGTATAATALVKLDNAVMHLRDVLLANLGVRSLDQAGRLRNLAATIMARARIEPDTRLALHDAQAHLEQAIDIYASQDGDPEDLVVTRRELNEVRSRLAT